MANAAKEFSEGLARAVETAGSGVVRVEGGRRRPASGVVWAPGVVVTVDHAVGDGSDLKVDFGDGVARPATVAGRDASRDLAVLKAEGGVPLQWAELEGAKVGHLVLALGRPGKTVRATSGIISALSAGPWNVPGGAEVDRYLESDAPHSPGFSGGPLIDLDGRALGLNTSGLVRGLSIAIPFATVKKVVEQLLARGAVDRGYLGLSSQPVRLPEAVRTQTGEEVGLLVLGVEKDGPADKAGIVYGDTVLRLGPDHLRELGDLQAFLRAGHVGETVPVKLLRSGQVVDVSLTLGQAPASASQSRGCAR
jgi:S1-C subfamily serine protease